MPGYQTKQESIAVTGVANLTIRSLLDRQQFADPLRVAASLGISSAQWPMFGLLWPSGAELAVLLAKHPVSPAERILEIGCGLGLASLVAHRRGANVTASDCHPLAGLFMAHNLVLNGLKPMKYRSGQWGRVSVAPDSASCADGLPLNDGSVMVCGEFDLIIGSDVLYERDDAGTLATYLNDHAAPVAQVWIIDPHRGNRPAFSRHMARHGFALTEHKLDRLETPKLMAYRGRLLLYQRGRC